MAKVLHGKGVVTGVAVGQVKILTTDLTAYLDSYNAGTPAEEIEKLKASIVIATEEIQKIVDKAHKAGEENQAAIMEAHIQILNDPVFETSIFDRIEKSMSAPRAMLAAGEEYASMFESMNNEYFKERAADVRDVSKRVVRHILGIKGVEFGDEPIILCAAEIEPSVMADIPIEKVQGVILGTGSTTSHAVIIAKSRGLVTVVGLAEFLGDITDGEQIILDGYSGEVILSPDQERLSEYKTMLEEQQEQRRRDLENVKLPAVTTDGVKVQLAANIGGPADMDNSLKFGCEGIGLFRTEFLFMGRENIPTEEEQFNAYRQVAEKCGEHICVIRTMDIGGDKPLPYLQVEEEENPFLGYRALRISLQRPDVFIPQLKALLRAAVYGQIAIMLPMVIGIGEIRKAKAFLEQAKGELRKEGKEFADNVPVGIMIETPAAAVTADLLAKECDFFSIGTNDLVQYTLAVDRGNVQVSPLYNQFHPAVLKLIANTIKAAHDHGIWAGMCGEMAGDPLATALLVAMGMDELSMSAPAIPRVKEIVRKLSSEQCKQILDEVLAMNDADEVRDYLRKKFTVKHK